jgi:hypothetical protein
VLAFPLLVGPSSNTILGEHPLAHLLAPFRGVLL